MQLFCADDILSVEKSCGKGKRIHVSNAETAAGRIDGFFEAKLNIWDYAAGQLLVEEAGGKITDYTGRELTCRMKSGVVCGNPAIHALLVEKYLN